MKTRSAYGDEVTSRARRVVGDIFSAMGHRAEHAVLIGGTVPGLIEELSLQNAPGHAGIRPMWTSSSIRRGFLLRNTKPWRNGSLSEGTDTEFPGMGTT